DADAGELRLRRPRVSSQGSEVAPMKLFHFFTSLPKEKVWADSCAKHGKQRHCMFSIEGDGWEDRVSQRSGPGYSDCEHNSDIGQQRKTEPLEDSDIAFILNEDFQNHAYKDESDRIDYFRSGNEQA